MTDDDVALGRSVTMQRRAFAEGCLSPEHVALLEQLPGWVWNAADSRWEQNFADLGRYIASHDNAYPGRKYLSPTGANIDTWVRDQRKAASADTLSEQRRRRLESLPGWSWNLVDLTWEQSFSELAAYAAEHGHANPLHGNGHRQWISAGTLGVCPAGRLLAGGDGEDVPERIRRLEALPGWVWSVADALWEDGFAELAAFCEATGSATPPSPW